MWNNLNEWWNNGDTPSSNPETAHDESQTPSKDFNTLEDKTISQSPVRPDGEPTCKEQPPITLETLQFLQELRQLSSTTPPSPTLAETSPEPDQPWTASWLILCIALGHLLARGVYNLGSRIPVVRFARIVGLVGICLFGFLSLVVLLDFSQELRVGGGWPSSGLEWFQQEWTMVWPSVSLDSFGGLTLAIMTGTLLADLSVTLLHRVRKLTKIAMLTPREKTFSSSGGVSGPRETQEQSSAKPPDGSAEANLYFEQHLLPDDTVESNRSLEPRLLSSDSLSLRQPPEVVEPSRLSASRKHRPPNTPHVYALYNSLRVQQKQRGLTRPDQSYLPTDAPGT